MFTKYTQEAFAIAAQKASEQAENLNAEIVAETEILAGTIAHAAKVRSAAWLELKAAVLEECCRVVSWVGKKLCR